MSDKKNLKSICFVSPWAYPLFVKENPDSCGGAERQFFLMANALAKKDWRVSFVMKTLEKRYYPIASSFYLYFADFSYLGNPKVKMPRSWHSLWQAFKRANADYYVLKTPAHLLPIMNLFCKRYRRKLIFWSQMSYDAYPHERFEMNRWASWLQDWGIRRADFVIAQNEEQREGFRKNYGIDATIIPSIAARVGNEKVEDAFRYVEEKPIDVLWVGNSHAKKRYEIFLEVAKKLPHNTFFMAMNNSDSVRFLEAKNQADRITNVHFLGTVHPFLMETYFRKAKLYLNTSLREGFPNVFLQAWNFSVPVLSLCIDPDDIIKRYQLGYVFDSTKEGNGVRNEKKSIAYLVSVITSLLRDPEQRQLLGKNGKDYVRKFHDSSEVASQFTNTLKTVVK